MTPNFLLQVWARKLFPFILFCSGFKILQLRSWRCRRVQYVVQIAVCINYIFFLGFLLRCIFWLFFSLWYFWKAWLKHFCEILIVVGPYHTPPSEWCTAQCKCLLVLDQLSEIFNKQECICAPFGVLVSKWRVVSHKAISRLKLLRSWPTKTRS